MYLFICLFILFINFSCSPVNETAFPQCMVNTSNNTLAITGEDILHFYHIPGNIWLYVSILLASFFGFRIGGYLVLRYLRGPPKR